MKKLPIRFRTTLWFSSVLILVVALTVTIVLSVSSSVMQKNLRDNLIEIVENNVDEIEYYNSMGDVEQDYDSDHYIEYRNGYIEIDDDFLNSVNGITTSLYNKENSLVYGENPIAKYAINVKFEDANVQKIKTKDGMYYVFDRKLSGKELDGLWLRGVVSEKQGQTQTSAITKWSLIILPVIVLIAIGGGYFIAKKSLDPIKKINEVAVEIGNSQNLKKRINIGDGNDELHRLANTFDDMFDKLEQSFEAERQFVSDASHELRTPMAVIMAQCEYSLDDASEKQEYIESLTVIQRQGKKMTKLISDMLDFAHIERKTEKYPKEEIDLSQITESVCNDMALLNSKGIQLTYDIENGVVILGNRQLIERMIINLITNAYRYGKEEGHIKVCLKTENDTAFLSVQDDGIGISEENINKIFNRFFQVDLSHNSGGTGLGLSMVKEIATLHDGTVHVESVLGKGSEFSIKIPLN